MSVDTETNNNRNSAQNDLEKNYGELNRNLQRVDKKPKSSRRKNGCRLCKCITLVIFGSMFLMTGIWLCRNSLFEYLMKDRLNMQPGLPAYEFWKNPQPEVTLRVFIWNVTNGDEFMRGEDDKLKMQEVGPVVFVEYLTHSDVHFNENSTLSYMASKKIVFQEDRNEPGILNKTIFVPNFATLGIASYLSEAGYIVNFGAKVLMANADEKPIKEITIYDYLWNYKSEVLSMAKTLGGSFLVPVDNMGVLDIIYHNFNDHLNVKIGPKYNAEEFFYLNSYNHRTTVPGFKLEKGDCNASILESTEGAIYPQNLTKASRLYYLRKTLCRPAYLYFTKEVPKGKLLGYKYELPDDAFDRTPEEDGHKDCYKGQLKNALPDGLSDLSKCFHNFPMAASKPHFLGRQGPWVEKLEGLHPDRTLHDSYIILEPNMGVPIDQVARSQSNLVISDLHFVYSREMKRFDGMIIPMFWLEYHQKELTPMIVTVVDLTVNYVPKIEPYLGPILTMLGIILLSWLALILVKRGNKAADEMRRNNKNRINSYEIKIKC